MKSKCSWLEIVPEYVKTPPGYTMNNSGGVETEVGEFIYSLVRLMKPSFVLETGTYCGFSSSYIGLALKFNNKGKIVTLDPIHRKDIEKIWVDLEIKDIVEYKCMKSLDYNPENSIDILFLDSEPCYRFHEFVKFFDKVTPGGIIMIHDLHSHLSYFPDREPINGIMHWPYGDFRLTIGPYIKNHQVQTFSFPTPRGFTIFQKTKDNFSSTKLLMDKI